MDPVAEMKMLLLAAPQLGAVAIVLVATAEQTVWCHLPAHKLQLTRGKRAID